MASSFSELFKGNSGSEDKGTQVSICQEKPWFVQVMTLLYVSGQSKYQEKIDYMICVRDKYYKIGY